MPQGAIEVIPVLDLKGGKAVRARQGLRHSYAPVVTSLARTSAPLDVVAGYLALHPFRTIYIADLDAIEQRGSHEEVLAAIFAAFPGVTFWVDAGLREKAGARAWLVRHKEAHLVLGSESLAVHTVLEEFSAGDRIILSLDYRGDLFIGPHAICDRPQLWPARVIVMTLTRVGCGLGPDLDRLGNIRRRAPDALLYAAGGLHDVSDLMRLKQAGISGVLVASALHDGRLTRMDLAAAMPPAESGTK